VVTVDWEAVREVDDVVSAFYAGWVAVYRVGWLARAWPRRLGADASGRELAADKKLSNRVSHMAMLQANRWAPPQAETFAWHMGMRGDWLLEEKQAAAVLDWYLWVPAQAEACVRDWRCLPEWVGKHHATALMRHRAIMNEAIRALGGVLAWQLERAANGEARERIGAALGMVSENRNA
jgi:hypothetical protein